MQKLRFYSSYSHILLPIAKHNALIWRVLTVLLEIGALPASRSEELVPHEGFEMSRKNPGTVIEIFRDNLGIEKFFYFISPKPKMIHHLIRSVPWMMLNCSETRKNDEFKMKWNVMLEKNAQFSEWIFTFFSSPRNISSNAVKWCFSCCFNWIQNARMEIVTIFSIHASAARKFPCENIKVFWGRLVFEAIRVVHTLMQSFFSFNLS